MRVLFLPAYFTPENMSSTPHDTNLHEDLAAAGIEMVVFTPVPTRNVSKGVRTEYKKIKLEEAYNGLMTIHRFNLLQEGKNPVGRAIRYTLQCIKQINRGLFYKDAKKCDVLYVDSTPPIQGAMAAIIKIFRHIPIVYKLGDVFPDSMVGAGLTTRNSMIYKIGRKIENFTYKHADKIIVVSEDIKNNLIAKGVTHQKIEVVYDWVDTKNLYPVKKEDNSLYDAFCIDKEKFNVVYAGNLGNAQNISILIEAAKRLRDNPIIQFIIFGSGDVEDEVRSNIDRCQLSNVKLFPLQPPQFVRQVYSLGDVCIVSCKPGFGGHAMPSKTWTIMACARPVIASFDEGELEQTLTQGGTGLFSKAGDIDSFVDKICYMEHNRNLCEGMGIKGRLFVESHLSRSSATSKIISLMQQVIDEK